MTTKPRKYRNVPVEVDGVYFASKREYRRWAQLQLLQRAGQISDLRRQVKFSLDVNGVHVANYIADAVFNEHGKQIIEDAKGLATDVYKLKRKLMLACHGIAIREV